MSLPTDVRQALRGLARDRAYTTIALLTLAFGLAANTVIFSLVDGVLLRPLRYKDAGRLVAVTEVVEEFSNLYPQIPANGRHYDYWRHNMRSFAQLGIADAGRMALTGQGEPEQVETVRVSTTLLPMLGVQPRLGRLFAAGEDTPGRDRVVLISEALWQRRFGAEASVIGRTITLDGTSRTVLGVLPASFRMPGGAGGLGAIPSRADVCVPLAVRLEAEEWWGMFNYRVIARLAPGVSEARALAELNVHQAAIAKHVPDNLHMRAAIIPLQEETTGASRKPLLMLLAAVGVVLLIVCVNLANLALARGTARQRDAAIRRALGATRAQLVRAALVESLALALGGGLLGVGLSWAGLKLVLARAPIDLPRLDEVHLDARVMLFALALSAVTGLLFGALPAWRAATLDPQASLRQGGRTTDGRGGRAMRNTLVALESALGVVLLVVAGLLMASFFNLLGVEKGFDPSRLVTAQVTLPRALGAKEGARQAFYRDATSRLQAIPGVTRAGMVSALPLGGEDWVDMVQRDGEHRPTSELPPVNFRFATPGYFEAAGVAMVAGSVFSETDRQRNLAVISEETARVLWPGQDAVGKRFSRTGGEKISYEIAGVVRDVRVGLDHKPVPTIYLPSWDGDVRMTMNAVVRTDADPRAVARSIRQAVWSLQPDTVVGQVRTMDSVVDESVAGRRFQMLLTAGFAACALLLACVGIYGVVSWSVARRRNEIGVRMALGARSGDVHRMIVGQGLRPVLAGVAAGLVGALALGRVMGSLLFGVSTRDPLTFGLVAVTLTAVAALACYLPARRATVSDPLRALRYE